MSGLLSQVTYRSPYVLLPKENTEAVRGTVHGQGSDASCMRLIEPEALSSECVPRGRNAGVLKFAVNGVSQNPKISPAPSMYTEESSKH